MMPPDADAAASTHKFGPGTTRKKASARTVAEHRDAWVHSSGWQRAFTQIGYLYSQSHTGKQPSCSGAGGYRLRRGLLRAKSRSSSFGTTRGQTLNRSWEESASGWRGKQQGSDSKPQHGYAHGRNVMSADAASHGDSPDADGAVGVPREEGVAVGGPAEREARDGQRLLRGRGHVVRGELRHDELALEVPDLDAGSRGRAEPVPVRGEHERIDRLVLARVERVQVLALLEVPQHGSAVLAAGRAQRACIPSTASEHRLAP
eukprot:2022656-Rhodomonas_salina.3